MSYTYTDVGLPEDRKERMMEIRDMLDNMSDDEQVEWIDYLVGEDKVIGSTTDV